MKARLRALLNRFPRLKAVLKGVKRRMVPDDGVSTHYVELAGDQAGSESVRLRQAWQDDSLPARQRHLVDAELAQFRSGTPVPVFDVLVRSLRDLTDGPAPFSLLEIGCSSGYYAEVMQIANVPAQYTGCDYSAHFIAMARERYPERQFDVEDATRLRYDDAAFDVVVSGCCLLHIPEYAKAVAETARVARRYVIFHRTPVVVGQPDKYYRKLAYGVETIEIHFNEPAFLALLDRHGLERVATHTLDETIRQGVGSASRTYVCRKKAT
ncbi:MAG: class I SAM-dependent methyltransferase [Rhodocyclaceae bacterium]|nr:class I SAM-dependent methyltransferase [Rhodocyclaceae bacterium]MCB1963849.1 class I SAM-dependent methyltransferase [Rhodocyclaceae bacterium]